jgi:hypothetical protein
VRDSRLELGESIVNRLVKLNFESRLNHHVRAPFPNRLHRILE